LGVIINYLENNSFVFLPAYDTFDAMYDISRALYIYTGNDGEEVALLQQASIRNGDHMMLVKIQHCRTLIIETLGSEFERNYMRFDERHQHIVGK
jgi:hypothetical protein